jgi:hypothetical protein
MALRCRERAPSITSFATERGKLQVKPCPQCPVSDGRPEKGGLSLRANSGRIAVPQQTTFMGKQRTKSIEIAAPFLAAPTTTAILGVGAFPHNPNSGRLST